MTLRRRWALAASNNDARLSNIAMASNNDAPPSNNDVRLSNKFIQCSIAMLAETIGDRADKGQKYECISAA
jgi:hypothetical protein|eukprot:COSAG02_NODE_1143_length_14245_cov_5.202743_4_plen_71_part_00